MGDEDDSDVVKSVLGALKAYLNSKLPLDKDFFKQLDSRGLLASNTASELAQLADQGKQDCVWKLVTYMEQFYTEETLLKLCAFLEEYAQQARPKLATIASKIRQEISKHKPQASPPALEDPPHHHSAAGGHHAHTVPGTSVPATFPPGSSLPKPPALYTPVPTKVPLSSRVAIQRGGRGKDGPSSSQYITSELSNKVISDEDAALRLGIVAALDLSEGTSQQTHTAWLAKDPPHRKIEVEFSRLLSRLAKIFNKHIDDLKPYLRTCQKNEEWPFKELEVEDIDSANKVQTMFNKIRIENCWLNTEIFMRLIYILPKKSHDKAKQHLEDYHKLLGVFSKYVLLLHIPKHDARLKHFYSNCSRMFPKFRVTYDVKIEDFDVSKLFEEREFLSEIFQIPKEAFHYLEAEPTNSTLVTWALAISIEKAFELIQRVAHEFWSLKEHLIAKVEIYGVFQLHLKGMSLPYHIKNALQGHQEFLAFTEHVSRQFLALVDYVYSHPKRKGTNNEPLLQPAPLKSVVQPSGPLNVAESETQRQARPEALKSVVQPSGPLNVAESETQRQARPEVDGHAGMVTFDVPFADLKDSGMEDCVSLPVDKLDERSTPLSRPTHEDEDKDLSTSTSKKGENPPRNLRKMCQKTLECGGGCYSIAVQGNVICVGGLGRVLLFSKTSGAQVSELGSDQIKGSKASMLGVAFIDKDTIVVSAGKRLRTYTTKGQLVRTFHSGNAWFYPHGLTVGPDGSIFVCDWHNDCVCVFNVDGKLLSSFGSVGSGVGQFTGPRDVCMDGKGLLFISDWYNSRICVHSVEGAFIREFPTPRRPCYVAATHCNHLVVSSESSHTVMIMTTSGQLVHEFGMWGTGPGQLRHFDCPYGVAVDNEDCVYVCDSGNSLVKVY